MDLSNHPQSSLKNSIITYSSIISDKFNNNLTDNNNNKEKQQDSIINDISTSTNNQNFISSLNKETINNMALKFGVKLSERDVNIIFKIKNEISSNREGNTDQYIVHNISQKLNHTLPNNSLGKRTRSSNSVSYSQDSFDKSPKKQKLTILDSPFNDSSSDDNSAIIQKKNRYQLDKTIGKTI